MQEFLHKKGVQLSVIILLTYFFMKYISPFASPFLVAFLIVWVMNPYIERVHGKTGFRKTFLAGLLLLIWTILFIWVLWILSGLIRNGGGDFLGRISNYFSKWDVALSGCCDCLEQWFGLDSRKLEGYVMNQITAFSDQFQTHVLPALMGKSMTYMKSMVSCFAFLAVVFIAVLLLVKDYGKLMDILNRKELEGFREVFLKVVIYLKTFLMAQVIILLVISMICALTLSLIGMKGAVLYGFLTGFMDMLPFIGTGIMLIPLAIIYLFTQEYGQAAVCIGLYAVCAFLREMLEPRLIGNKIGIWPVGILFSVFAGISLFGVVGVIKGPLSLVIICETVRFLWDTEDYEKNC